MIDLTMAEKKETLEALNLALGMLRTPFQLADQYKGARIIGIIKKIEKTL